MRRAVRALVYGCAISWCGSGSAQMPPATSPVIVETKSGKLEGDDKSGVLVFQGVPYAAAPVGPLRWSPPQPVRPWPGIRTATAAEPACTQPVDPDYKTANGGGVVGAQSEDCLYLQVHAPKGAANAPVVVWFHGGAFFLGAGNLGSYDGSSNARNGVVTVSVNYRLGALGGFMHPALIKNGKGKAIGNYALMDAVAALEWVKTNIAAFGGNPANVTIAGQSAGGGIVTGLLSMTATRGLYHKAIIQSGALLYPDREQAKAAAQGVDALKPFGIGEDVKIDDLRRISAQSIASRDPVRRGLFFVKDPVGKPQSFAEALDRGTEVDVPVLVGSNAGEPGFGSARKVATLAGDAGAPAFLYRFDYVPEFRRTEWVKGPIHSAELMFTFASIDQSAWGGAKANAADRSMATFINGCWTAFYKMDPSAGSFSCPGGYTFRPFGPDGNATRFGQSGPEQVDARALPDGPPRPAQ